MRKDTSKLISTVLCSAVIISSSGSPFPVLAKDSSTGSTEIASVEEEPVKNAGGIKFFEYGTGKTIEPGDVYLSAGYEMEDGYFCFPSLYAGDTVDYRISIEGYEEASGSITLGEEKEVVYVDLVEEHEEEASDPAETDSIDIDAGYEEMNIDLADKVPEKFRGASFTLIYGEDVLEVSNDGKAFVKGTGSATVEAVSGNDVLDINVVIDKKDLGNIGAADIEWDVLEKEADGSDLMEVTGTVKNSAGVRTDDVITVRAAARTDSAEAGIHNSILQDVETEGDENYTISVSETGPAITIIGKTQDITASGKEAALEGSDGDDAIETSIAVSHDDELPLSNEKYFNADHAVRIKISAASYDESKTMIKISGSTEFEGTIADIKSGLADGVELVSETKEDNGAQYSLLFGDKDKKVEAEYILDVSYDGTAAEYEAAADDFVVDEIAPKLTAVYKNGDDLEVSVGNSAENTYYETSQVEVTLKAEDGFFGSSGADVHVKAADADGNAVSAYPESSISAVSSGEWEKDGSVYTFTMDPFNKEANYEFSADLKDLAGNEADPVKSGFFTVDRTAPEGTVTVTKSDGTSAPYSRVLEEKEIEDKSISSSFGMFDDKYVTLDSNFSDSMSGIASAQYALIDVADKGQGTFDLSADMSAIEWKDWEGSVKVDTDRVAVILEKITDRAGHITYLSSEGAFIVDTKEPSAPVITIGEGEKDIYSGNVAVQVSAEDPDNGGEGVFSGVKALSWEVKDSEGNVTQSGTIDAEGAHGRKLEGSITILADKNRSNTVTLTVRAQDYAGNISESGKTISIDSAVPKISTTIDMTGVKNGKYFASTRKIVATFNERNFDPEKASMSLKVNGQDVSYTMKQLEDGAAEASMIRVNSHTDSQAGGTFETYTDDRMITYELLFGTDDKADIDYENIVFAAQDSAGNKVDHTLELSSFTVDKVAPVITVSYAEDNKDITKSIGTNRNNPRRGTKPVKASMNIEERNFDVKDMKLTITAKDSEDKDIKDAYPEANIADASENWKTTGTKNTKELMPFENDANYSLEMSYTDLAGNRATAYKPHYFTVDQEAPKGKLFVEENEEKTEYYDNREKTSFTAASPEGFSLTYEVSDTVSGIDKVEYIIDVPDADTKGTFDTLTKEELEKADWQLWETEVKDGKTVPKAIRIDPDAHAVVYMKVTDGAGNIFYINTDGIIADKTAPRASVTVQENPTGFFRGDVKADVSGTDPVSGGTYSGISTVKVSVASDGKTTQETELSGAEVSERLTGVTGNVTVDASKNNSNNVEITVRAFDNAGNVSEDSKKVMIDTAAPVISTSMDTDNVRHGKYFNETKTMTVNFRERNFDPSKALMRLVVDGTGKTFTMKELSDGAGTRYGITVTKHDDTQANTAVAGLTDSRENIYEIAFGSRTDEDTEYRNISFEAEDLAGNSSSHQPDMDAFAVDKVAPVMNVHYSESGRDVTDSINTNEDVPYYTQGSMTVSVNIKEKNFFGNGVDAYVTAKDYEGNDTGVYGDDKASEIKTGWTTGGDSSTNSLPVFSEDSNYGLALQCEDLAGNRAQDYPFHYFTVDKTAPEGAITVNSDDGSETYDRSFTSAVFRFISRLPIRVTRAASDRTSGIASVQFCRYEPSVNASGTFSVPSAESLREADWSSWNDDYYVEPDEQAVIYARIADRAGNILYISTEGAMIADHTEPERPDISITAAEPSEGIYSGDVPVSVHVEDVVSGNTYAGLKEVTVQVLNGGSVTQSDSYRPGEKSARVRSFDTNITVNAQQNNSNHVMVRVTVEDWAGNVSSSEKELAIDITSPRIEVSYDRNDPANGKYYNTRRVATITVYERNFNPARVNLAITGTGNAKISDWTIGSQAGESDDNPNTCTIIYDEDSDYTFTMDLTDKAGNAASYGQTDSFTIDTTMPVISVSYDNNDGRGIYYNAPRTATVRVDEVNFDAAKFTAAIQASLEGTGITPPSVDGWTASGNSHYATITFDKDGDYSFTLDFSDLAENPAQRYTSDPFTIDLTKPVVEITGIEDGSANRKEAIAVIKFEDLNFDREGVVIRLKGYKHDEKDVTGTFEEAAKGGTVTLADFEHIISEDDVYTLTAYITDKAGNTTEKSITFSVNRFGSNFYYGDDTKEFLESYYKNTPEDLVIYEINVNTLVNEGITVYKNGETTELKEGQYSVEDLSKENDWKRYKYTIDKSVIDKEGVYEILISSVDEAGNKQDNKLKEAPITFVLDKTAPSVVITGVEDGEVYNETKRDVTVQISDNYMVGNAKIFVDGKSVGEYTSEDIAAADGKVTVEIKESTAWQTISANVTDAAGNQGKAEEVSILVTTSPITRAINGGAFKFAAAGLGIAAIAGGTAFIVIKKKKEEDEEDIDE